MKVLWKGLFTSKIYKCFEKWHSPRDINLYRTQKITHYLDIRFVFNLSAFSQMKIYRSTPLPSVLIRISWLIRNVLNRMGKIILKILRILFFELQVKIHQKLGLF